MSDDTGSSPRFCECDPSEEYLLRVFDLRRDVESIYDQVRDLRDDGQDCRTEVPHIKFGSCDSFVMLACDTTGECAAFAFDPVALILSLSKEGDILSTIVAVPLELDYSQVGSRVFGRALLGDINGPVYEVEFSGCAINEMPACP